MGKISDKELLERLRNDPSKSLNDIEKEIREEEEIERWEKGRIGFGFATFS